jgi:hypothetical protein
MRINIAEPCHENWDVMGPNPNGKHCSKCDKTVYDFSRYTDSEIIDFFKTGPKVCGRFAGTQLGRDLSPRTTLSPKWAIAACGVLLLSSASLNAQNNPQLSKDSSQETVSQQTSVILNTVINATFNEASTRDACISRMRIKIDSFSIDVDIDSSRKTSVTIPQTLSAERVDVELFNIKGDTFHLDSVNLGTGNLVFIPLANGRWMYTNPLNYYVWSIPDPPIYQYMGIPMQSEYVWGPPIMPNVLISNPVDTSIVFTYGDTVLTEALVNPDSNKRPVMRNMGIRKKQGTDYGPWVIGIIIGLGGILALAWRRIKNKIRA